MEEYKYNNFVFKPRITNWIKYRIPSIEFKDKYKKFKLEHFGDELEKEIQKKIITNKELLILSMDDKSKIEFTEKLYDEYPELCCELALQNADEKELREKFLIDNDMNNIKILFDIVFDNSNDFDFNSINSKEEYEEFYAVAELIFNDFFSPLQKKNQE